MPQSIPAWRLAASSRLCASPGPGLLQYQELLSQPLQPSYRGAPRRLLCCLFLCRFWCTDAKVLMGMNSGRALTRGYGVVQPADAALRPVPPGADRGGCGVPSTADGAHAGALDRGLPLVAVLRRLPGRPGGCAQKSCSEQALRTGRLHPAQHELCACIIKVAPRAWTR